MTLRQEQFIAKLPENGFNMAKTMREVGYSKQSSDSGRMYGLLRAKVEQAFSKEAVQAKILKAEKKFIKDNDNANYARMVELQAKASGLTKDSSQNTQVNVLSPDTLRRFQADVPKKDDNSTYPDTVTPCATTTTSAT